MSRVHIASGELAGTREIVIDSGFAHALAADDDLLAWWPESEPRAIYFEANGQLYRASGQEPNPWKPSEAIDFQRAAS